MTTTTSVNTISTPLADGLCGYQHGMAPCLPMADGRTCCSVSGFCGANETYCFVSNGCQYGCVDPASFYTTRTTLLTQTINATASVTPISKTTTFFSTTSSPNPSSTVPPDTQTDGNGGFTGKKKTGAIAGGVIGGVAILVLLVFLIVRSHKKKQNTERQRIEDAIAQRKAAEETPPVQTVEPPVPVHPGLVTGPHHRNVENED